MIVLKRITFSTITNQAVWKSKIYNLAISGNTGRYIPWMHLTAAGALHLTANIVAYFGPICTYDIFLTLGLLFAVVLSAGEYYCRDKGK